MFHKFPKIRPALPPEIERIYSTHYQVNREGGTAAASLAQRMEAWLHRQVARDVQDNHGASKRTLELGAGTLNQLQYEPPTAIYDIVEPFQQLFAKSSQLHRIRHIYSDISEIPNDACYDRISSVAVLEHICNLPDVIAKSGVLLADGGIFRASIPSEGTWLWTLGWKLTTGLEFKWKHHLDYGDLMRHEHVNTADEIEEVLRHFFTLTHCKVFGLSRAHSLYRYYECKQPHLERCRQWMAQA